MVPGSHRHQQPTLHPNTNDKELLVQATLQWHNNGVHWGLFTIGDIPEHNASRLTDSRRRRRKRQAAMQDNPSRLSSQRKGQHRTRERLCTTFSSPPLGSLSNTIRIYIAPCPHPQQGQLPLLCFLWLPDLLMEEKMTNKTCLSVLVSLQDMTAVGRVLLLGAYGAISQKHNSSISSRTKSHHIWTAEYNQIFTHVVSAQWDKCFPISSQRWERKAVKAEESW